MSGSDDFSGLSQLSYRVSVKSRQWTIPSGQWKFACGLHFIASAPGWVQASEDQSEFLLDFARVFFPSTLVSFNQGETQSFLGKSLSLYCDKTSNRNKLRGRGRVSGAHSLRGQSALKRKSRRQKHEAARHIVSMVRKQT